MKKRPSGEGTLYQRKSDGRWVGAITTGWSAKGQRRELVYGRTRAETHKKMQALQARRVSGLPKLDGRTPLRTYLAAWAEAKAATVRPRTAEHYRWAVTTLTSPAAGLSRQKLAQLSPSEVEGALRRLQDSGFSPRSCAHVRAVLRNALRQALRDGLVARNVAELAEGPEVPSGAPRILEAAEVEALLAAIPDAGLRRLVTVSVHTGLRQGELLGLRWSDVNWAKGEVRVSMTLQRLAGEYRLAPVKTKGSERRVPLTSDAVAALEEERRAQAEARPAAGRRWKAPVADLVFTTPTGQPRSGSSLNHQLHRACEAAGLEPLRWHHLRHAFAGLMLGAGVELAVVSQLLGHSSAAFTADVYGGILPGLKRQAADRLGELLKRG